MKKSKAILILPITAAVALIGTGFGAWVFSSSNNTYHTGANIEVADAYGYDNLKVEWINRDLVLNQNADHTDGAPISSVSFSVKYTAQVGIGGTNIYIPGADGAEGDYQYSSHNISSATSPIRAMGFRYTVTIMANEIARYVTPTVTVKEKSDTYYRSKTDISSITNVGAVISVTDKITSSVSTDIQVEDIVTVSFAWNNVPTALDNSSGTDQYNYADLKSRLTTTKAPLVFGINMVAPSELNPQKLDLDTPINGKTLRTVAADSDTVIFGTYDKYKEKINGLGSAAVDDCGSGAISAYTVTEADGKITTYILSDEEIVLNDDDFSHDYSNATNMLKMGLFESFAAWAYGSPLKISTLTMENVDTSQMTCGDGLFIGLTNLTTLDLSGMDTSNMTSMMTMFGNCSSLTELDLTSFDTSKVTDMTNLFAGCSGLTKITVSSSFVTDQVTASQYMFAYCWSLPGYKWPKTDRDVPEADKSYASTFLTYESNSD